MSYTCADKHENIKHRNSARFHSKLRNFSNQWLQYCSRQFSGRLIEGEHQSGAWPGETLPSGNVVKQFSYVDTWNVRRFLRRYWTTWKYPTGAGRERRGECRGQSAWSEKSFRSWWLDLWQNTADMTDILHIDGAEWWRYHGITVVFFKIWLDGNDRVDGVWGYIQRRQALHKAIQEAQVVCCTAVSAGSGLLKEIQFPLETGFKNFRIFWLTTPFCGESWYFLETLGVKWCTFHLHPISHILRPHEVLIDEASQATEPATLVPICHGCKQLVLCGDHCQLPPTVKSDKEHSNALKTSLFERLALSGVQPIMLNIQYLGLQKNTALRYQLKHQLYIMNIFQYISSFKDHFPSTSMLMNLIFALKGSRWRRFFKHALFVANRAFLDTSSFRFQRAAVSRVFLFCLPSGCFQK